MQNFENPEYQGGKVLDEIEGNLGNYSNHIVSMLIKYSGFTNLSRLRILDFGAGRGTLAKLFLTKSGAKPKCAELDPALRAQLREQGFEVCELPLKTDQERFDFIYTSNVLEHIEDDEQALRQLFFALTPGGVLAIYVPAFPVLFSNLDTNVGHFRRYTKNDFLQKLTRSGFKVETIRYVDSLGFIATLILKSGRYRFNPTSNTGILMKIFDLIILPLSRFLDFLGARKLFGKNILVVARRP